MKHNIPQLIAQMTLEEKASLCSGLDFWHTKPIERLGIPSMMVSDGPHGLRKQDMSAADHLGIGASVPAVCFPTASLLACSWDRELVRHTGTLLAEECQQEQVGIVLGPGVNIKRSPLCGRNFEYYSEDPLLAGELAASFAGGVQSQGVGTSLKHYAANNQETRRMGVNAVVDERALMELYLMPFEYVVKKAQPWTVMCSYNRVNGEFACQNEWLLTTVLREMWGFVGYVMTDWGALDKRVPSLIAGTELEMPASGGGTDREIVEAARAGTLDEAVLDRAVTRMLNILFRWEETKKPGYRYDGAAHHAFARKAAAESIVLAKNEGGVLPFRKGDCAVIGEYGKPFCFQGGGSSHINPLAVDDLAEELEKATGCKAVFASGYRKDGAEDAALLAEAVEAAKNAANVVVVLGLPDSFLSEGVDRPHMKLADNQNKLVEAVLAVRPDAAIVITCGSAVELPWIDRAKAVLIAYLGGQAVAGAVSDILTGAVNPSGKLAETWPKVLEHNPSHLNFPGTDEVHYRESIYVGYRYYDKKRIEPMFPFGYGLSYTSFEYSNMQIDKNALTDEDTAVVTMDIKNTGAADGYEIAQLYVCDVESTIDRPIRELKGFEKVFLKAGETKTVSFLLDVRAFAYWDTGMHRWSVESGKFVLSTGPSSDCLPLSITVEVTSLHPPVRLLTRYSTMGEAMEIPEGKEVMMKMFAGMAANVGIPMDAMNFEGLEQMQAGAGGAPVAADGMPGPMAGPQPGPQPGQMPAPDGAMLGMDIMTMIKGVPLKTAVSFSNGMFTDAMLDDLLNQLNQVQMGR